MGDSVLVLLRDEFKENDLNSKRRASERLDLVAKALGPDKTKKELIPWLKEHLEQEDEILYIFAKKCSDMLDMLNGGGECLLPVVENLLEVEETFVREAAVECASKLIRGSKDSKDVSSKFVEILTRLSKNDWFTSRISCCSLVGPALESSVTPEEATKLREMYQLLCKDETPMVRRAAGNCLKDILKSCDNDVIVGEILPLFSKLSSDPQESVAMVWINNFGEICAHLSPEKNKEHTLEIIKQLSSDRSWRVRNAIALCFDRIASGLGESNREVGLAIYCELFRDPEGEVRTSASFHLLHVLKWVGADMFVSNILPVVNGLVEMDQQERLRRNIAETSVNSEFGKLLGEKFLKESIVPLWSLFLGDQSLQSSADIRLIIVEGFNDIITTLGASFVASTWSSLLSELYEASKKHNGGEDSFNPNNMGNAEEIEHPQWRLREAILRCLPNLASANDPALDTMILNLWYSGLGDDVYEVRSASAVALGKFCDPNSAIGQEKVSTIYIPKLLEFFKQAKGHYQHRIVFSHCFGNVLEYPTLAEPLYSAFEKCLDDKVPNVRVAALNTLLEKGNEATKEMFSQKLNALVNDSDPDCSRIAKECVA